LLYFSFFLNSLVIVSSFRKVMPGMYPRGGSRIFVRRGCTSKEWRHYPGFFLGGGAPLRNDVTDQWGKQMLKANTKKKAPPRSPPRSAPVPSVMSNLLTWSHTTSYCLSLQFNTTLYSKVTVNSYVSSVAHSYVLDSWFCTTYCIVFRETLSKVIYYNSSDPSILVSKVFIFLLIETLPNKWVLPERFLLHYWSNNETFTFKR